MVGIAAAIGVVTAGRDLTLVVEQPIEHMRGFAGGRRDHLGVERRVSVGEVRVELDPGFSAVMGIDAARFTAEAAGPKELAIRGGGGATAKHRRKRLALLLIDQKSTIPPAMCNSSNLLRKDDQGSSVRRVSAASRRAAIRWSPPIAALRGFRNCPVRELARPVRFLMPWRGYRDPRCRPGHPGMSGSPILSVKGWLLRQNPALKGG